MLIQILMISLSITIVILMLWGIFSPSISSPNQSMNSPFESGFENMKTSFIPFNSQYFMIAMVFLIFDLEITMILPIPISSLKMESLFLVVLFLLSLTVILLKEVSISVIEWVK